MAIPAVVRLAPKHLVSSKVTSNKFCYFISNLMRCIVLPACFEGDNQGGNVVIVERTFGAFYLTFKCWRVEVQAFYRRPL